MPIQGPEGEAMTSQDGLAHEVEALRRRIATLSAAILRMSETLDLEIVLREVVEGARALIGARYGAITPVDASGQPETLVTSGFTDEDHRALVGWSEGPKLFEFFRDLPGPLQIPDVTSHVESLGFSAAVLPSGGFLGTPMRHRGVHVGNFYLVEKESGSPFNEEDEEILMLFASQAATAIAHARTYRAEQRARADLEALIETSPVGVAVFDAATGALVSLNREARRIVSSLCLPDQTPEQLLEVLTFRRADGREARLDELQVATTVRAEEIVLSAPGGPSVTTLINATPIHGEDGAVVSVIVTMQDLAPLEELERQRAAFLEMVSHELRAPLISVKGAAATALGTAPRFDPAETTEFFRIIDEQADRMRALVSDLLDAGRIDSGMLSVYPEPCDVATLVDQARRTFQSGGSLQPVQIDLPPGLPWVMVDARRVVQVLNNLFSNAARSSAVSSPIEVSAVLDGPHIALSVADEGRGIAPEDLPHLFTRRRGGSGPDEDRGLGAAGLGLVISKGLVEAHGGRLWAESAGPGQGARFTFTVPVAEGPAGASPSAASERGSRSRRDARQQTRILVVDDDPLALRFVRDALVSAGYAPVATGDPRDVPRLIRSEKPKLLLLDLMLPETDGLSLMERVPELAEGELPAIFLSVYGGDETVAKALAMGAADYIAKPFSPTELVARVEAVLRRRSEPSRFVLGGLAIDHDRRRVTVGDLPVELTATEFALLRVLSLNAGRVLTYDTLLRQVWDTEESRGVAVVRTFVKRLRRSLGDDAADPAYIFSVRGVGYRMPGPEEV